MRFTAPAGLVVPKDAVRGALAPRVAEPSHELTRLLALANLGCCMVALINSLTGTRLPLLGYMLAAVLQVSSVAWHLRLRNLFSASLGSTITVLLVFSMLLELSDYIAFGPWYPARVYSPEIVSEAYSVLLLGGGLFFWLTLTFGTTRPWPRLVVTQVERRRAAPAAWWLFALGAGAVLATLGTPTIFTAPYPFAGIHSNALIVSSGLQYIGVAALGISLIVGALAFGIRSRMFIILLALVLILTVWTFLLRGARGAALPVLATVVLIPFLFGRQPIRIRIGVLVLSVTLLLVFYQFIGTFRWSASQFGPARGFDYAWSQSVASFAVGKKHGRVTPMDISTAPQSYWHILQAIDLYNGGNRLWGSSFIDVVLQAVPLFVADYFGWERPISEQQRLSMYRLHGGGMYAFATAYWNLGLAGVALVALLLGLLANWIESWFRRQTPLLIGSYLIAVGTLPYAMFFGWQSLARGLEIVLVVALILRRAVATAARSENPRGRVI